MIKEIQLLAIVISLVFNFAVILILRNWAVNIKYSLPWVGAGFFMLLFSIFPEFATKITGLFGISQPINTLFFFAIIFSMLMLIMLTVTISKLKHKIQKLSQITVIQQNQIDKLLKKQDQNEPI